MMNYFWQAILRGLSEIVEAAKSISSGQMWDVVRRILIAGVSCTGGGRTLIVYLYWNIAQRSEEKKIMEATSWLYVHQYKQIIFIIYLFLMYK